MRPWLGYIENAAHVKIEVVLIPFNGFELVAQWKGGQEYRKHFSAPYVQVNKKTAPCDHARAFLREVLEQRGVA